MKYGSWLIFLAGCIVSGCVGGTQQQKGSWPWEHANDYGNHQTGDYIAISGNVANFGEVPKAMKPVIPESPGQHVSDLLSSSGLSETKTSHQPLLPAESKLGLGKIANKPTREYDFKVSDNKIAAPSYMPANSVRSTYEMTAFNHGSAPVSVSIGIDTKSSENISIDKTMPLTAVVPPNTDQVLLHFAPKMKNETFGFRYAYSWSIGDYTARHKCPEHYQFPFGDNIRAFASVSDKTSSTPNTRYAVIFSMPASTPVLAARKGTVVQIMADDKIDILHDDSTIGTYSHLGKIAEGVVVGKTVSAWDIIGMAGAAGNRTEAYVQLAVWRPEPLPVASQKTDSQSTGFNLVSFPLEFCSTDSGECRVLTQSQPVSRNKISELTKQGKRRSKSTTRHNNYSGRL